MPRNRGCLKKAPQKPHSDISAGKLHGSLASTHSHVQARKKSTNPNFWVRMSSGGVGVFHVNGWGAKSSVCLGGPQCIGILPILHKSRKIKNPPKLRNSETPAQKLRNSNSETQKVRVSEFQSFRVSEAEFPSFRGRVSESQSFRVGQFRAVLALAQKVQNTTFTVVGRILGVFVPDFFGQNRATQKLRLKNSETQTQKLVFRVSESDFPSFRVRLSEFPKLRGFRAVRVRVDSNTLAPLKVCPSKPGENTLLGRMSRDFGWDILRVPEKFEKNDFLAPKSGADMTGRPGDRTMEMNGRSTASYLTRTPRVPFLAFSLPGATWDHFPARCTVEPSPSHIRLAVFPTLEVSWPSRGFVKTHSITTRVMLGRCFGALVRERFPP